MSNTIQIKSGWTLKISSLNKLDTFEMWLYRRFLKIPWTARVTNNNIHKANNICTSWWSIRRVNGLPYRISKIIAYSSLLIWACFCCKSGRQIELDVPNHLARQKLASVATIKVDQNEPILYLIQFWVHGSVLNGISKSKMAQVWSIDLDFLFPPWKLLKKIFQCECKQLR